MSNNKFVVPAGGSFVSATNFDGGSLTNYRLKDVDTANKQMMKLKMLGIKAWQNDDYIVVVSDHPFSDDAYIEINKTEQSVFDSLCFSNKTLPEYNYTFWAIGARDMFVAVDTELMHGGEFIDTSVDVDIPEEILNKNIICKIMPYKEYIIMHTFGHVKIIAHIPKCADFIDNLNITIKLKSKLLSCLEYNAVEYNCTELYDAIVEIKADHFDKMRKDRSLTVDDLYIPICLGG